MTTRQELVVRRMTELELPLCVLFNRVSQLKQVRALFATVSRAGDGIAYWLSALALLAVQRSAALGFAWRAAITHAICLAIYTAVKRRTSRPRPFEMRSEITLGTAPLDRYSFPSGHTMHAVAFAILLTAHCPGLGWVALPFAAMVGFSRLVLGLHYPTDVLAGAMIGGALAGLAVRL